MLKPSLSFILERQMISLMISTHILLVNTVLKALHGLKERLSHHSWFLWKINKLLAQGLHHLTTTPLKSSQLKSKFQSSYNKSLSPNQSLLPLWPNSQLNLKKNTSTIQLSPLHTILQPVHKHTIQLMWIPLETFNRTHIKLKKLLLYIKSWTKKTTKLWPWLQTFPQKMH